MSLPESMSRIVIVGTKSHMDEAIDALYSVKAIHLIDHTVDADEGFSLGTPRPYSPKASERLLKVRAMEKELGITKHVKAEAVPEDEIKGQISSDSVELVEKEVLSVLDKRNDLNQRITELNATKKNLSFFPTYPSTSSCTPVTGVSSESSEPLPRIPLPPFRASTVRSSPPSTRRRAT